MKWMISTALLVFSSLAWADDAQLLKGRETLAKMTGCYLVDYSYVETESLKQGYTVDRRVYDANKIRSIKEWIYMDDISPTHIRLQHILFGVELNGKVIEESMLRHQAEDWEYNSQYLYDFESPARWKVKDLKATPNSWTRKITSLDDGPRYQCASTWSLDTENAEWSCANLAPIPGRETRDMKRKDYNVLDRFSRVMVYSGSWLERQENTKVIYNAQNGSSTPLAKELGKNWYVRLPDSECTSAQNFAAPRGVFWGVLRETWADVLNGQRPFREKVVEGSSRYFDILNLEEKYMTQNLLSPEVRAAAKSEILQTIEKYRE